MRKSKEYCSHCTHWKPTGDWSSTCNPHFAVVSDGICEGTGRLKLNCQRACTYFMQKLEPGFIAAGTSKAL
jgi:hypothetical protein